jgi:nitrogen regulatory protein P-II 2
MTSTLSTPAPGPVGVAALPTHSKTMLMLITEATLERRLVADVLQLGALGYTVSDVRGGGQFGVREGLWEADRSIELKVVCEADVAQRIAAHVHAHYAPHYGLSLFMVDVAVLRANKY